MTKKKKKALKKAVRKVRKIVKKKVVKKPKKVLIKKKKKKAAIKKPKSKKSKKKIKKKTSIKRTKAVNRKPKKFTKKKSSASKRKKFKKIKPKKPVKKATFKKRILKSKPKRKRRKKLKSESTFLAESFFKAKIKVIGIGGGGGSIVSEIGRSLHKATFVVADTDVRAFKKRAGIKNFLFGQKLTHGLGTGVNPELGRMAAEAEKERIAHFFDDQDIVILIASLGGGLGSGATQVFAQAAENFNGITFGIFTLPFKFEGKNKYKIAQKSLHQLRKSLNVSITIPNERIFKIIKPDTAITDAFSLVNKNLIESLESLIDLIYSPGVINIDFADLRAILNGKGNVAFLNTMEASGKDRAEIIAKGILHNSLYQNSNFKTEKILFNIAGANNVSMFEVDKISRAISEQNKKAKIIFGFSKHAKYKNKIKTTLLMTGNSTAPALENQTTKKAEEILKEPIPQKTATISIGVKKSAPPKKKVKKENIKTVPRSLVKPPQKKQSVDSAKKDAGNEQTPFADVLVPIFGSQVHADSAVKKLNVVESPVRNKKPIRRSALEIKEAEEIESNKQSLQEKEWEIPAFLRIKK